MTLTQKETELLHDLRSQEQLCVEKYGKYRADACDCALKGLFGSIQSAEQSHLDTVDRILRGEEVRTPGAPTAVSQKFTCEKSACDAQAKQNDAYLCRDALSMEKHVSSLYNTSVFEFSDPVLRDTLAHIQKEEQNHGEQLYNYLAQNGLYHA